MSRRVERALVQATEELERVASTVVHTETLRSYCRASRIVAAMAGYFSEAGTTTEQDILLESIGVKPPVDRTPPTPPPELLRKRALEGAQ